MIIVRVHKDDGDGIGNDNGGGGIGDNGDGIGKDNVDNGISNDNGIVMEIVMVMLIMVGIMA